MLTLNLDQIKKSICDSYSVEEIEKDKYIVHTPHCFDDGDGYCVIIKKINGAWGISDEGQTLIELSYYFDLKLFKTTRKDEFEYVLDRNGVVCQDGEFIKYIDNMEELGTTILEYINFTTQSYDLLMLTQDRVESMFYKDLNDLIKDKFPKKSITKNYYNLENDPDKFYTVDYKLKTPKKEYMVFALKNKEKVYQALLTIIKLKSWSEEFSIIGIYEDIGPIPRKVRNEFNKQSEVIYPNFYDQQEIIGSKFEEMVSV